MALVLLFLYAPLATTRQRRCKEEW